MTTGAAGDLRAVAELASAMVHEYAMGSTASTQRAWVEGEVATEAVRRVRDEEQRELGFEAHRSARALLAEHRAKLEELAGALLERETLRRADLDRILDGVPRVERRAGAGLRLAGADGDGDGGNG